MPVQLRTSRQHSIIADAFFHSNFLISFDCFHCEPQPSPCHHQPGANATVHHIMTVTVTCHTTDWLT